MIRAVEDVLHEIGADERARSCWCSSKADQLDEERRERARATATPTACWSRR